MKIYRVGGAVRDELLGRPISDRDFVVVGATPEEMIARGFRPVGRDFPVFLHPESGDEYALARTERKSGRGYHGFSFHFRSEEMIARGFRPVGRDFPVFLHPESGDEYALARTERKSGRGYHGFSFHVAPEVTLEEDLGRRDLTINAMARDAEGTLIEP